MHIKIHQYPEGSAFRLGQDDIVSKVTGRGRFSDCYVGDLKDGDRYVVPVDRVLPEISAEHAVNFIDHYNLNITRIDDVWIIQDHIGDLFAGEPNMNLMEVISALIEMEEL